MTPLTSSNLVTLGGKRHPGNINEESASTVKYSNVKTRQFPNRFISDCRVRILWSAETDVHCFPKQNNNNNNNKKSCRKYEKYWKQSSLHDFSSADCRDGCQRNIMEVQRYVSMNSIDLSYQKDLCSIIFMYQVNFGPFSHPLLTIITNNNLLELMVLIYILSSS